MLRDILVGSAVCIFNIVIHAWLTVAAIRVARILAQRKTVHPWRRLVGIMIALVLMLMSAHMMEVFVWAAVYALVNAAPAGADLVYFAFVNYTTLGYGDIMPVDPSPAAWPIWSRFWGHSISPSQLPASLPWK